MTVKTIDAIYEHGVFRLPESDTLDLEEGQRVRLTVEFGDPDQDPLSLLAGVYDGLSSEEIDKLETIIHDRSEFFGPSLETSSQQRSSEVDE